MKRFLQAESDEKSVIKANSSADLLSISGAVSMFLKMNCTILCMLKQALFIAIWTCREYNTDKQKRTISMVLGNNPGFYGS